MPVRVSEAAQGTDENATHVSTSIIAPSGSGDGVSFSLSRVFQSASVRAGRGIVAERRREARRESAAFMHPYLLQGPVLLYT